MNRLIGFLLLTTFACLLVLSLACGGSGYEGEDPKNAPAREAVGLETPEKPDEAAIPQPTPPTGGGGGGTVEPGEAGGG